MFDTAYYLRQYPDVVEAGLNPLVHYLECGAHEDRKPNPLFDTAYYLSQYPDVAESGLNPLVHYLECGAYEDRKPNPLFDSAYYLNRYADVLEKGRILWFTILSTASMRIEIRILCSIRPII